MKRLKSEGFTLAEIVLGAMVLAVAAAAILGAYVGQVTLNEHARNLSLAIQDANRIIERIREGNASCGANPVRVDALSLTGFATWNAWLADTMTVTGGGGKSIQPDPNNNEFVAVTCQDNTTGAPEADCQSPPDPLRVTVAVCWRHRGRIIGECNNATPLTPGDGQGSGPHLIGGVIESPAMLTTLVTCRG